MLKDLSYIAFAKAAHYHDENQNAECGHLGVMLRAAYALLEKHGHTFEFAEAVVAELGDHAEYKQFYPYCYDGLRQVLAEGDAFLTNGVTVYYVPENWLDKEPTGRVHAPVCYCYAPERVSVKNAGVTTQWVPLSVLNDCWRISEDDARVRHPALFDHLKHIEEGN